MKQPLKSFTEFGPLIVFFVAYKFEGLIYATGALVVATVFAVAITYYVQRKIPLMPLISAGILGFFGGLTVFSGNDVFIKIKPTLINLVFASILLVGVARGKGLLKYLFDGALQMSEQAWKNFSLRWALFFLLLAVANEFVWRNFATDIWVQFKVFGIICSTFIFMLTQFPFIKANAVEGNKADD